MCNLEFSLYKSLTKSFMGTLHNSVFCLTFSQIHDTALFVLCKLRNISVASMSFEETLFRFDILRVRHLHSCLRLFFLMKHMLVLGILIFVLPRKKYQEQKTHKQQNGLVYKFQRKVFRFIS